MPSSLMDKVLGIPFVRETARGAANWVDLQWSLIYEDLKLCAPKAKGALLDVGCGDRPYESLFAPFVQSYVGVEHEASFTLTHASSADKRGPDVLYDGNRLPFDDATFDTVLNVQVLEHTPEPQRLISEMSRVLKPGGTLIIIVPFSFRLHEEPHDYFRYSPHGLRHMIETAGLEQIELVPHGSLWSLMAHKFNSYLALQVARMGGVTQAIGKLNHEATESRGMRLWAMPMVLPMMASSSAAARVLDRALPDPTEALSFRMIARKR